MGCPCFFAGTVPGDVAPASKGVPIDEISTQRYADMVKGLLEGARTAHP